MKKPSRIKVLHVAPQPPPLGGMVTYIQGLLSSNLAEKVDLKVVRFDYLGKEQFVGIKRVIVNFLNSIILTTVFVLQSISWRPHIVHIQTNSGFGFYEKSWIALLANLLGSKTLMHVHGGNFREFYKQSSTIAQLMIRWCAQLNARIITASPQMRDTWLFIGIPETKIVMIGNAVNLPVLVNGRQPYELITILFLTRIVLAKGILELIDAVRNLHESANNIRLRIVGAEEIETAQVKKYLSNIKESDFIQYVGPVSEPQKHKEYLAADIFAFPTHVEDQSYAVMEAMSYGLPCVASNVGGVPSLIRDGKNGLLVPPKDVDELASALKRLICNSELRTSLGSLARDTIVSEFTWDRRADQILDLYYSLFAQQTNKKNH